MIIVALAILFFCVLVVFKKCFHEGMLAKHCFAFAAMAAACVVRNPDNNYAFLWAVILLLSGLMAWGIKKLWGDRHYGRSHT